MKRKKIEKDNLLNITQTIAYCKKRLPNRSFSEATLYRHIAKKSFPSPIKIVGVNYWRAREVHAWITKLVDGK